MNKIPFKPRLIISVALFGYTIVAIICTIYMLASNYERVYPIPIFISAIVTGFLAVLFAPLNQEQIEEVKQNKESVKPHRRTPKRKRNKKPFITEEEWKELEEEEEELDSLDDDL